MFLKINKSENFTPGFIMVLHTFGRDLKWNPHIHCLLSEGGFSDHGVWRNVKYFSYTFLRNAFRTALLDELESRIGPSFKKTKSACYSDHKDGFYIYAKPNKCDPQTVAKYIGRYLGRPVIATSRIDSYDGEMVTFHYNRHEDDKCIEETIPAIDFIKRLIRHIPEKHFKMIRYGGLYARHREADKKLRPAVPKKNSRYSAVSLNGGPLFFLLSAMILLYVQNADTRWNFWNCIITISAFPSKNFTGKLCPDPVESVLLRNFL